MTKSPPGKGPELTYVDQPSMPETFADSVQGFTFDGHTLRVVFTVTRFDEPKLQAPATAKQYPACRLVVSLPGAIELINQMYELRSELIRRGVMKHDGIAVDVNPSGRVN